MDFTAKLTELFVQVEPHFLKARIEDYRRMAETQHKVWTENMVGPIPEGWREVAAKLRVPAYTKCNQPSYASYWDYMVKHVAAGHFEINYDKAEKDARFEVAQAKVGFVKKNSSKLANATKLRTGKPKVDGSLAYVGGIVTGRLAVVYGAGDKFDLAMSIKWNYRNGRSYHQFPAIFQNVLIGGKRPATRISENWMGENF